MKKSFPDNKNFKKIALCLLIVLTMNLFFEFISQQNYAQAQNNAEEPKSTLPEKSEAKKDDSWWGFISRILGLIFFLPIMLFAWILSLEGKILDVILQVKTFTDLEGVRHGWTIIRDFVNMFFIIVLLVIAFATILKIEAYGYKRLIPKLIAGVLLVNFSLFITGIVIDASQVALMTFANKAINLSETIANAAGLSRVLGYVEKGPQKSPQQQAAAGQQKTWWQEYKTSESTYLSSMIMITIMYLIAIIVFGIVTFLFLVRIVALWFLAILSPFAFLLMILPATGETARKWWNALFRYAFFGPIMVFFLYILHWMIKKAGGEGSSLAAQLEIGTISQQEKGLTAWLGTALGNYAVTLLPFFLIMIFLVAGVIAARAMGIYGAAAAISYGQAIGKRISGYAGKQAQRMGLDLAGRLAALGVAAARRLPRIGSRLPSMAGIRAAAERLPVLGRILGGPGTTAQRISKQVDDLKKNYKNFADQDLDLISQRDTSTAEQKMAALDVKAERGKLNEKDFSASNLAMLNASPIGAKFAKAMVKAMPNMAPRLQGYKNFEKFDTVEKVVDSYSPEDMKKIQPEGMSGEVSSIIAKSQKIKPVHLSALARNNTETFFAPEGINAHWATRPRDFTPDKARWLRSTTARTMGIAQPPLPPIAPSDRPAPPPGPPSPIPPSAARPPSSS